MSTVKVAVTQFLKVSAVLQYLDEKLPAADEAKDALISRMREMVNHAQKTPEYKESMNTLIHIAKKYMAKAQEAAEEVKENTDASIDEDRVTQAGKDLKTFAERLAGKSLDPVVEAGQKAADDIRGDPKLKGYFEAIEQFMDRCMNDPSCESATVRDCDVNILLTFPVPPLQTSPRNEPTERPRRCTTMVNLLSRRTLPGRETPTSSGRSSSPSSTP